MKTLAIAGNYREFQDWLINNNQSPKDYIYVQDNNWRGFHNIPIVKIGTWYKRDDIPVREIEMFINQ